MLGQERADSSSITEEGRPGDLLNHGMSRKEQVCGGNMVNHHSNVNDENDAE